MGPAGAPKSYFCFMMSLEGLGEPVVSENINEGELCTAWKFFPRGVLVYCPYSVKGAVGKHSVVTGVCSMDF